MARRGSPPNSDKETEMVENPHHHHNNHHHHHRHHHDPIDSSPSEAGTPSESPHEENPRSIVIDGDESTALMESSEERMTVSPQSTGHSHDHRKKKPSTLPCTIMIVLTFLFFIVELVFGFINTSIALLADSYHMLSDVFALNIALICLWISHRPSKYSTFGWVRAETYGALVNGVWLLTTCFTIAIESLGRLINPHPISHPHHVFIVGFLGLIINIIGMYVFHRQGMSHGHSHDGEGHGHSHSHKDEPIVEEDKDDEEEEEEDVTPDETREARAASQINEQSHHNLALELVHLSIKDLPDPSSAEDQHEKPKKIKDLKNLNMHGAFLHVVTDAVGSVIVMISSFIVWFFPNAWNGIPALYLDPCLSLIMASFIGNTSRNLIGATSSVILRSKPSFVDYDKIANTIRKIPGVANVDNISCWTLVANRHMCTAEIEFASAAEFCVAMPQVRRTFHRHGIHSLTIQPKFSNSVTSVIEE